jgi:hypothetical protein
MSSIRFPVLGVVLAAFLATGVCADEKEPQLTAAEFRTACSRLLEDPSHKNAPDFSRAILIFAIQSPDAVIVLGDEELKWIKKEDNRGLLLFAAYMGGNAQSQLHSGVKRNDRYSGLLYLFQVYRQLQAKDKDFRVAAVDDLLKMHKDDKLIGHLAELEKKQPTKLSPEDEEAIRKLMKGK